MGRVRNNLASMSMWILVTSLLSQNLVIHVMSTSFEDEKNYYNPSPDPHAGTPPSGSNGSSPPSHSKPPSHGTPSIRNCGPPSHDPSPPHNPSPSTPSGGGGGYYDSPPPTPIVPTPSTPSSPYSPIIPIISTPPSSPTPPFLPDPNSPPFTCNYWRNHPSIIRGILGFWRTLGNVFGVPSSTSVPGFGAHMSLTEALSNTRSDGLGELYRQGTAALLNSMVDNKFHFTTKQVRDNFVASLSSNEVAASQARLFKLANEGKIKPRA